MRFYGLQGRRGAGNPGRGFASLPMGLRLECNSKDYLIGCGLSFRIKVWHLPKTWVRGFLEGEGTLIVFLRIFPQGPTPS